jgi:hypothetical protein
LSSTQVFETPDTRLPRDSSTLHLENEHTRFSYKYEVGFCDSLPVMFREVEAMESVSEAWYVDRPNAIEYLTLWVARVRADLVGDHLHFVHAFDDWVGSRRKANQGIVRTTHHPLEAAVSGRCSFE